MPHGLPATPRDAAGDVDYDEGWKLWTDMVRYYPSGVHRRRLVCSWLRPLHPHSILDAGCGPGEMLGALREAIPEAQLTGVDHSGATVEENRRRLPWATFEQMDLSSAGGTATEGKQFDAVVCSEVLEHIHDDEAALSNLVKMTRRWLMLTVPTGPILPLEAGFGHLRHYTIGKLTRSVEDRGLRVIRAQAWGFPWMTAFKRAANLRPQSTLDSFGAGEWSLPKKAIGAALTRLFYLNLPFGGPQLLILAERTRNHL